MNNHFHTSVQPQIEFSSVQTLKDICKYFPDVKLHSSIETPRSNDLIPGQSLSLDFVRQLIHKDLAPGVLLARKLLVRSGEKYIYYFVYEVFRAIARFNHGTLALATPSTTPEQRHLAAVEQDVAESSEYYKLNTSELKLAVERYLKLNQLAGFFEFQVLRIDKPLPPHKQLGPVYRHKIQLMVEVKAGPLDNPESLAQTVAGLLTAAKINDDVTWAALTDFYSWRFFKASKLDCGKWEVRGSTVLELFSKDFKTTMTTRACLSMLFESLFYDHMFPKADDFNAALRAMDDLLLDESVDASISIEIEQALIDKEQALIEKEQALIEKDQAQKEIANLKVQLSKKKI